MKSAIAREARTTTDRPIREAATAEACGEARWFDFTKRRPNEARGPMTVHVPPPSALGSRRRKRARHQVSSGTLATMRRLFASAPRNRHGYAAKRTHRPQLCRYDSDLLRRIINALSCALGPSTGNHTIDFLHYLRRYTRQPPPLAAANEQPAYCGRRPGDRAIPAGGYAGERHARDSGGSLGCGNAGCRRARARHRHDGGAGCFLHTADAQQVGEHRRCSSVADQTRLGCITAQQPAACLESIFGSPRGSAGLRTGDS